jgi:hypothetical protein
VSNLYFFLVDGTDYDGETVMSDAALECASKGVAPLTITTALEFVIIKFSSRRRLNEATAIARRYMLKIWESDAELVDSEDYEFRGNFTMRCIDRR